MMLTGGIEAAEGKSYLDDTGRAGLAAARGADADAGGGSTG